MSNPLNKIHKKLERRILMTNTLAAAVIAGTFFYAGTYFERAYQDSKKQDARCVLTMKDLRAVSDMNDVNDLQNIINNQDILIQEQYNAIIKLHNYIKNKSPIYNSDKNKKNFRV